MSISDGSGYSFGVSSVRYVVFAGGREVSLLWLVLVGRVYWDLCGMRTS